MTIELRPQDAAFLTELFADGEFRKVNGEGNNLAHPSWGNADQPFVRLTPAHFEPGTVNGVRQTGASGSLLPNERLISDVVSERVDQGGQSVDMPNTHGTNLLLMSFGQFFDHGLDFYDRGGGSQVVDLGGINGTLSRIAAANPGLNIDTTDNILAQGVPPQLQFLIGGRAARYTVDAGGHAVLDNAGGTEHLNKVSPFVDQNQTYGSEPGMTWLLRETARDAGGQVMRDAEGYLVKTFRLLDGHQEVGPDGVSRGTLATYRDILLNNGLAQADMDHALLLAGSPGGDQAGWNFLRAARGFVDFADIGDGKHTIMIGDKNDFDTSPLDRSGNPDPNFSLESLLSYYVGGDHRANENVALTAVHTVFHREHNVQAGQLHALHPEWSDEQVFQMAKVITSAEYQRVVFDEFAAKMSGEIPGSGDHGFSGYDPGVNATISDEFAGAMYRVGHSMINETIPYVNVDGTLREVPLIDAFLNPAMFGGQDGAHPEVGGGTASFIAGSTRVAHQRIDEVIVEAVRSELLGLPLDLGAANIMRGRELGLPSLNEFRSYVSAHGTSLSRLGQDSDYAAGSGAPSMTAYQSWDDFGAHLRGNAAQRAELLGLFKAVYGEDHVDSSSGLLNGTGISHVNDVDLWIGGLAENPTGASQMGATFTWIFQEQLDRLQEGDRFYYLHQLDGTMLVNDINAQHLSDLIARNTGIAHGHWDTFQVSEERDMQAGEADHDFSAASAANGVALVLVGNGLGNVITGSAGDNTIYGGKGDDTISGGGGNDALHGEDGNDTLYAGSSTGSGKRDAMLYGEAGDDRLNGGLGGDSLFGGDGADTITGGAGKDFLSGGAGDDWLTPGSDRDEVDGGAGTDTVDYGASGAGVTIDLRVAAGKFLAPEAAGGDAARDNILNVENVIGSRFADRIRGDAGANLIEGGAGADVLSGEGGFDIVSYEHSAAGVSVNLATSSASGADAQGDTLSGFEGVRGGASADTLKGSGGDNLLGGNGGNDTLSGAAGNDTLTGGAGTDRLEGGLGQDSMLGGADSDTYLVDNTGDIVVELAGGGARDVVFATANWTMAAGSEIEELRSNYGAGATGLTLTGNDLVNLVVGGGAADRLFGGGGNDRLAAGAGNDTLEGGMGADRLEGAAGADTLRYHSVAEQGDTIIGFVSGLDRVEVSAKGFGGGLLAGALLAGQFAVNTTGQATALPGQGQFVYESDAGRLWWDADGAGGASGVVLATLPGHPVLALADISVIA